MEAPGNYTLKPGNYSLRVTVTGQLANSWESGDGASIQIAVMLKYFQEHE